MKIEQITGLQTELNALKVSSVNVTDQNTVAFTTPVAWMTAATDKDFTAFTGINPVQFAVLVVEGDVTVTVSNLSNLLNAGTITKYFNGTQYYHIIKIFNVSKTATSNFAITDYFGGSATGATPNINDTWAATNIINGNTTPLQLVAAPGVGKAIDVKTDSWTIPQWATGRSAYTGNVNIQLRTGSTVLATATAILSTTSATKVYFTLSGNLPEENEALIMEVATGDPTSGGDDFDVEYSVDYRVKDVYAIPEYADVPGAPTDVTATVNSGTSVTVDWVAPSNDGGSSITGYKIERNLNSAGFATLVVDTGTTAVTYDDNSLSLGDNVIYRISAINSVGTGSASTDVVEYGNNTVFGSATTAFNQRRAQPIDIVGGVTITSVAMYMDGAGTESGMYGVYRDSGNGEPNELIGITEVFTVPATASWATANLITPIRIDSNQRIYVSWIGDSLVSIYYQTVAQADGRVAADENGTWADGMPYNYGNGTQATTEYSIYVNVDRSVTTTAFAASTKSLETNSASDDSYIDLDTTAGLYSFKSGSSTVAGSISALVKIDDLTTNVVIFNDNLQASTTAMTFQVEAGYPKLYVYSTTGTFITKRSTNPLAVGTWYHVVVTWDTSNNVSGFNIYINGVLENGDTTGTSITEKRAVDNPRVGINGYNLTSGNGHIDELSFWEVELSQIEVQAIMIEGKHTNLELHSQYANIHSWFRMESNANDFGPNGYDGTASGNIAYSNDIPDIRVIADDFSDASIDTTRLWSVTNPNSTDIAITEGSGRLRFEAFGNNTTNQTADYIRSLSGLSKYGKCTVAFDYITLSGASLTRNPRIWLGSWTTDYARISTRDTGDVDLYIYVGGSQVYSNISTGISAVGKRFKITIDEDNYIKFWYWEIGVSSSWTEIDSATSKQYDVGYKKFVRLNANDDSGVTSVTELDRYRFTVEDYAGELPPQG